ncbi:3637_t:CDS:2 [Rhizophagus irregularis]|nr:3637_t:CDS:2 [Rhizophagus irregularis]
MNEIFKNFHDDKRSLYYCSLVNRYWCQLAIPWLWSQPIFNSESKDESISPIETLISCLDINSKIQLSELKIPIPSQRPLFEYTTFLKKLDHAELCAEVVMWLRNGLTREQLRIMRVVLPLSLEVKNILNIIIKELYKHFIKNSNLQMIILKGTGWGLDIPNILTINNLISGISNLRTLCYSIQPMLQIQIYENMLKFLDSLPNLCKDIENLELSMNTIDNNLERIFYNIIISQNNLTKFIFDCEFGPISKIINSLYTQSNSITFIEFRNIDFYCISLEFLLYCSYLKDLRLYDYLDFRIENIITSILSSIKFLPLEYLAIHCCTNPLKSLKENLPLTLKQLEIDVGIFQAEDLDDLLKDCQAPLKTMIIREGLRRILDNYIPILIDFTLKKKTLQTVGFYFLGGSSSFSPSIQELKKYVKVIKPSEISNHNTHTFLWSTIQLNNKV